MSDFKFTIVQDGTLLSEDIKKKFDGYFNYRDIRGTSKGDYFNFVGCIFLKEEALLCFPKHYFTKEELIDLNNNQFHIESYSKILFQIIQKSLNNKNKRLFEVNKEINKSYPFESFLNIYQYYQKYRLFTKEREIKKFGYNGKILWKDTINKSPMVINHGNILFMPTVIRKDVTDYVFVSKCMAYVINSTINKFNFIFNMPQVQLEYRDVDFTNSEKIISLLSQIKSSLFKDIHRRLIDDLITFFRHENRGNKQFQIKIYQFNLIWEDMVNSYLNNYFLKVDENEELVFNSLSNKKNNFTKGKFELDSRREKLSTYRIEPDYYFNDGKYRYIFDAKYYNQIDKLDYKQISYYFLLQHIDNEKNDELIISNALILPTSGPQLKKVHFDLDRVFNRNKEFRIIEYYLNMKDIISNYLRYF